MNRTIITTSDAPTLDDLATLLNEREGELDDDTRLEDVVDLAALPTYGGAEPADTAGIYSWDAEWFLVPGDDGWRVEERRVTDLDEVKAILDERGVDYRTHGGDGILLGSSRRVVLSADAEGLSWRASWHVSGEPHEESDALDVLSDLEEAIRCGVTDEQIAGLRDESRGYDAEQVEICDAAFAGDWAALVECADVICYARGEV